MEFVMRTVPSERRASDPKKRDLRGSTSLVV
jgi:hypothetical protein